MEDIKIINSIKGLSIDMIDKAKSGYPGVALGAAPIIYTLYSKHLNIDLDDDKWINRDRFVLSGGHASALLYSMLFYVGYLTLDDLKNFRRINSNTPGHPEITTKGIDISTGPLGQGIANAVGMAIAERYLNSIHNEIDYYTYVMCGDGDLMEGISYEATSLAGTLNLSKLILLYDSNDTCLDGKTNITFNEDIKMRFESINWNYIKVEDGSNVDSIDSALNIAKESDKPTIIEIKTVIGNGSMYAGTNKVHGVPLTKEDITNLKENLGLSQYEFDVNYDLVNVFRQNLRIRCKKKIDVNIEENHIDVISLQNEYYKEISEELRVTNGKIMNKIAQATKYFIGGSADVSASCKTYLLISDVFSKDNYNGRNINYGVREHAMGAISNGIASCGLRPFVSTFLAFSDYLKPSIRMSALMNLPVIYVFTHDSINIGSDGATHQPVEQLSMLRNVPNLKVYRPADANEILGSWNEILLNKEPSALIISRNSSPLLDNSNYVFVSKGAYIIKREKGRLNGIIIATGTEVNMAVKIANELEIQGINIRVVSMPCKEIFEYMSDEYKEEVLPQGYRTIVIEYATSSDWYKYVTKDEYLININNFGKSGTTEEILEYYELDYENVKKYIMDLLK